jgi:hypothetical protein
MRPSTKTALALAALFLTAAPLWARPNISNLARECKAGKQNACAELAKIAVENKDAFVRREAVSQLTDLPLLARIAVEDKTEWVREQAVSELSDQPLLAKIAVEDASNRVVNAAVRKLTDQALLAKVALESPSIALAATWKLTDQALLARVALRGANTVARRDALARLTDQASLASVAVEGEDASVRNLALSKLTDQALLAKIAVEDKEPGVSGAAVWRLTDQVLLASVASDSKGENVRKAAKTALAGGETVGNVREVYIWRSPTGNSSESLRSRWRISGVLGAADLDGGILEPGQSIVLDAMMAGDSAPDSTLTPGFSLWQFAPENGDDVCALESGSFSVGVKEVSAPISFIGHSTNGKGVWGISGGTSDSKAVVFFRPKLYLKSDGTMVMGGLMASLGTSPVAAGAFSQGVSVVQEAPVIVTGTIRFPKDRWTAAGASFHIRGGGLQFDETGVFLMPGTEYGKDMP